MLIRSVAPSPGRTECGTAQNATVARRSVFERGSTFSLRGAPPPPTRQHRFNAASAWARVRLCGGVSPVPRGGGGGYNIKYLRGKTKKTQLRCERGAKINEPCDSAANEEHGECPYFCDAKRRSCGRGASGRLFAPAASANILRRGGGGYNIKH